MKAKPSKKPQPLLPMSRQQLKRQREWIYLSHFLAMMRLMPAKTLSGEDDGREPDFTCQFSTTDKAGYCTIGIELTTLPRLRDRLGNDNLRLKRWYWQSRLLLASRFHPTLLTCPKTSGGALSLSGQLEQTSSLLTADSLINQSDIDAVMKKKLPKIAAYQQRRPLDELWLLIHTNEQQEQGRLGVDISQPLYHCSSEKGGFDRVFISRYPSPVIFELPAKATVAHAATTLPLLDPKASPLTAAGLALAS